MEGEESRRFDRQTLFRYAAATGGAAVLAGRTGIADAMRSISMAETGRLQVMDWAGYGNDGGQSMFASYVKAHAANKPQFTYMTNESDALAKIHAGTKAMTKTHRHGNPGTTTHPPGRCRQVITGCPPLGEQGVGDLRRLAPCAHCSRGRCPRPRR